jgi:hypothetical protein
MRMRGYDNRIEIAQCVCFSCNLRALSVHFLCTLSALSVHSHEENRMTCQRQGQSKKYCVFSSELRDVSGTVFKSFNRNFLVYLTNPPKRR